MRTRTWSAALGLLLLVACGSKDSAVLTPVAAKSEGSITPDSFEAERVIARYGCTSCHAAEPERAERLAGVPAPDLTRVAERLTLPAIASQAVAPRPSAVTGDFACAADASPAEAFAIANWLTAGDLFVDTAPVEILPTEVGAGRALFDTIGCRGCHSGTAEHATKGGLDVDAFAGVYSIESLAGVLAEPAGSLDAHPDFGLNADQARRLATFVLAGDRVTYTRKKGLRYEYYHADDFPGSEPDWDAMEAVATGQTDSIGIEMRQRDDQFGVRLTGLVKLPVSGEYTFHLTSDDGSYLDFAGKRFINHGGLHGDYPRTDSIVLAAGLVPIQLAMFERTGGEVLKLEFEVAAPTDGAAPVERREFTADELFFDRAEYEVPALFPAERLGALEPLSAAELKAAQGGAAGRALFVANACAGCHAAPGTPRTAPQAAKPLADLAASGGCLAPAPPEVVDASATPTTRTPVFAFLDEARSSSARERELLASYLTVKDAPAGPLAPAEILARELPRLGCVGCHERDGMGGVVDEVRSHFGQAYDGDDLGAEGQLPPTLTDVGFKLQRDWIERVVAEGSHGGAGVRPYMQAKMPAFGDAVAARLADAFEAVDLTTTGAMTPPFSEAAMDAGRTLVGMAGFACISCHDVAGKPSLGIPMTDLANTPERLRHAWFQSWLEDPAAMRPGTRMSTFWRDGTSARTDVLDGHAGAQIDAIWTYLSLGMAMPLPDGLVVDPGAYDLEPVGRPIHHACFWRDGSARGIAVGFPERKHLAFDQEHLRLDKLWYGAFVNAADTWDGRAGGLVSPAGDGILDLPGGMAVAQLDDPTAAWPEANRRELGWRLLGSTRDTAGVPTFRYAHGEVVVEETLTPIFGPGGRFLRHFHFSGLPASGYVLRLAVGDELESFGGEATLRGAGLVEGDPGAELKVLGFDTSLELDGSSELRLALTPGPDGTLDVEVEYQW
ncbi:MAG: PA14 domain-containing protein [Planctomycetota bacterium]|nr:PA14 domain-containing protein [Planctomycetota bacterium]